MTQSIGPDFDHVAETLFATLYIRAMESQRADALLRDERAVALVGQMGYDFGRIKRLRMDEDDRVTIILRNREFDRLTREFLSTHADPVVVHIGCGLDTRFERVDDGRVEWYDLDLPEVIALRRKFIGGDTGRYHLLGGSAFEAAWLEPLGCLRPRSFLFLAEGVFMYFEESRIKSLILELQKRFLDPELIFDTFSPCMVKVNNLRMSLTKLGARYHWGLGHGEQLESWSPGIRLIGQWGYFDRPEPRLDHIRWMRHIPLLANILRIYHYRLGDVTSAKEPA